MLWSSFSSWHINRLTGYTNLLSRLSISKKNNAVFKTYFVKVTKISTSGTTSGGGGGGSDRDYAGVLTSPVTLFRFWVGVILDLQLLGK